GSLAPGLDDRLGVTGGTGAEADPGDAPSEPIRRTDKVDVLVMIDNSPSMADKQHLLQAAM
ncbi:MAG: hypothetical protein WCJ30_28865, partial [Deltaproteobacteria bacterium]